MSTKRILCKYFMHGACLKGETCEFSHNWADPSNNVCTFYQKGVCSYGSRCRYDHVKVSRSEGTTVLPNASAAGYNFPASYGDVFEEQSQSPVHDGGISVSFQPSMPNSINAWRQQPEEYVPFNIQEQSQSPVQDGGVSVSFQPSMPSSINAWRQQPEEYVPFNIQEQSQTPVQDGGVSVSFQPSIPSLINAWRQQPDGYVPFDIQRLQSLTNSSFRDQAEKPICAAFAAGRCAHGNSCPHLHGDLCPICGKHCLHPFRPSEREEHQKQCERNQKRLEALRHSQEIECCVCLERVLSKPTVAERKFGLLSSCDHAFCISCIRDWRSSTHAPGMDVDTVVRACPVCRVVSHYVIPSVIWYSTPEEKEEIVNGYKAKLSTIDCRYFDFGNGSCPFGTSCFYKHAYRDGTTEETKLRHLAAADGGTVIAKNVRLSDFLGRLNLRG